MKKRKFFVEKEKQVVYTKVIRNRPLDEWLKKIS